LINKRRGRGFCRRRRIPDTAASVPADGWCYQRRCHGGWLPGALRTGSPQFTGTRALAAGGSVLDPQRGSPCPVEGQPGDKTCRDTLTYKPTAPPTPYVHLPQKRTWETVCDTGRTYIIIYTAVQQGSLARGPMGYRARCAWRQWPAGPQTRRQSLLRSLAGMCAEGVF
jgi:hypothetical protein